MPDKLPYIGIDLGGTSIKAGLVNVDHKVIASAKTKTHAEEGSAAVVDRLAGVVAEVLTEAKLAPKDVGGIGIGAPGTIDPEKGVVQLAVNLRWDDFPLAEKLKKKAGLPVTLDNDVNVGAWGEHVAGAARKVDDFLAVFVGTGIGGGFVLDGKLYHGHFKTAGEIGHTIVHADAPLGRRTLENCSSRSNVVRLLVDLIQANHKSKLSEIVDGDLTDIRSKALGKALAADDALTREVVERSAHYVGVSIANVVTLLSLEAVVLGGGLVEALGKPYVKAVERAFVEAVFPPELSKVEILMSELGDDAGVIGAADLARRRLGAS